MENKEVSAGINCDTIVLLGDSRIQSIVSSFKSIWPHDSAKLTSKETEEALIDEIINVIEEELCKNYESGTLIVVLGLHSDIMMMVKHDNKPEVVKKNLEDLVNKISIAAYRWKNLNYDCNFIWCLPNVPDFKRYNNDNKKYRPYKEQDSLEIDQVRKYFKCIKMLKQIWENIIPSATSVLLDLNLIGLAASSVANPEKTFAKFEDLEKLPSFVSSHTVDGLHYTPKMAINFWNFVLKHVSQPLVSLKKVLETEATDMDLRAFTNIRSAVAVKELPVSNAKDDSGNDLKSENNEEASLFEERLDQSLKSGYLEEVSVDEGNLYHSKESVYLGDSSVKGCQLEKTEKNKTLQSKSEEMQNLDDAVDKYSKSVEAPMVNVADVEKVDIQMELKTLEAIPEKINFRRLIFNPLNNKTTVESFKAYCKQFGEIKDVFVKNNKLNTMRYGCVIFTHAYMADKAVQHHRHIIDETAVELFGVGKSKERLFVGQSRHEDKSQMSGTVKETEIPEKMICRRLIFNHLNNETTVESFKAYCKQFGEIEEAHVKNNKLNTMRYGCVIFTHAYMADKAQKHHPHQIDGTIVELFGVGKSKERLFGVQSGNEDKSEPSEIVQEKDSYHAFNIESEDDLHQSRNIEYFDKVSINEDDLDYSCETEDEDEVLELECDYNSLEDIAMTDQETKLSFPIEKSKISHSLLTTSYGSDQSNLQPHPHITDSIKDSVDDLSVEVGNFDKTLQSKSEEMKNLDHDEDDKMFKSVDMPLGNTGDVEMKAHEEIPEKMIFRRLIFNHLNNETTVESFKAYCKQFGEIEEAHVKNNKLNTMRYGCVVFTRAYMADKAQKHHPHQIDGTIVELFGVGKSKERLFAVQSGNEEKSKQSETIKEKIHSSSASNENKYSEGNSTADSSHLVIKDQLAELRTNRVSKLYRDNLKKIKDLVKKRLQNNIVIVTDGRDIFDISFSDLDKRVEILKLPLITFSNALNSIKLYKQFGNGTIFLFSCGTHDLLSSCPLQECLEHPCSYPQQILTLSSSVFDYQNLIMKALQLHMEILCSTTNDTALFCGLLPVNLKANNEFTYANRPCLAAHPLSKAKAINPIDFNKYLDSVHWFNAFVQFHSQMLDCKIWDMDTLYFYEENSANCNLFKEDGYHLKIEDMKYCEKTKLLVKGVLSKLSTDSAVSPNLPKEQDVVLKKSINIQESTKASNEKPIYYLDVEEIVSLHRDRNQSNILIVTDDRDNFDISLDGFHASRICVLKELGLKLSDAYSLLQRKDLLGNGTIFVFCCGTHDLISSFSLPECLEVQCPSPQTMLTLSNRDESNFQYLIDIAVKLNMDILLNSDNDSAIFCGLIPVHINHYNEFVLANRQCYASHAASLVSNVGVLANVYYKKTIQAYNRFIRYHANMLGFSPWNLHAFYFSKKKNVNDILLPNNYNITAHEETRRANEVKLWCSELLDLAKPNNMEEIEETEHVRKSKSHFIYGAHINTGRPEQREEAKKSESSGQQDVPLDISPEDEPEHRRTLLCNYDSRVTHVNLKAYFLSFGEIQHAYSKKNQEDKTQMFGYIMFSKAEMVDKVFKEGPHHIDSVPIHITRPDPFDTEMKWKPSHLKEPEYRRTLLCNFHSRVTYKILKAFFQSFGEILHAFIKKSEKDGSQAFGYIEFSSADMVDKVLKEGPHYLFDVPIQLWRPDSTDKDAKWKAKEYFEDFEKHPYLKDIPTLPLSISSVPVLSEQISPSHFDTASFVPARQMLQSYPVVEPFVSAKQMLPSHSVCAPFIPARQILPFNPGDAPFLPSEHMLPSHSDGESFLPAEHILPSLAGGPPFVPALRMEKLFPDGSSFYSDPHLPTPSNNYLSSNAPVPLRKDSLNSNSHMFSESVLLYGGPRSHNFIDSQVPSRSHFETASHPLKNTLSECMGNLCSSTARKFFKYDQIAIVADHQDAFFFNHLTNKPEVIVLADFECKMDHLEDYIKTKKNYLSKKTLYLLVIGIHAITKTVPAVVCQQNDCINPLQLIEPLTLDWLERFIETEIQTLNNALHHAKLYLPAESSIEILPLLPASLISMNAAHNKLHWKKSHFPAYMVAKRIDIINKLFPLFADKISELAKSQSLISDCYKMHPDILIQFSNMKPVMEMDCSPSDIPSYNQWKEIVSIVVDEALSLSSIKKDPISTSLQSQKSHSKNVAKEDDMLPVVKPLTVLPGTTERKEVSNLALQSPIINRELTDVIYFAKTILNAKKIGKQTESPGMFKNIFVVSNQKVSDKKSSSKSPLSNCSLNFKMIYEHFYSYDESDVCSLVNKLGDFSSQSVCCLMFDLSVIATKQTKSLSCAQNLCPLNLLVNALETKSAFTTKAMEELDMLIKNKVLMIQRFLRKLGKKIPVIILPLMPSKIFCDDVNSFDHQNTHAISETGSYLVQGPEILWKKALKVLIYSWNDLMEKNNSKYDDYSYMSTYIQSNLEYFPISDKLTYFNAPWKQPYIWEAFIETFLMSVVPSQSSKRIVKTLMMSKEMYVVYKNNRSSIPTFLLTELFTTIDKNMVVDWKPDGCILSATNLAVAYSLLHIFHDFRYGYNNISAVLVGDTGRAGAYSDLMTNLYVSSIFENLCLKWMPEIIKNIIKEIHDVPDLATLKVNQCQKGAQCKDVKMCPYYHSHSDKRRNPLLYSYDTNTCLHSKSLYGNCSMIDTECSHSRNDFEAKFHPSAYQVTQCSSVVLSMCDKGALCPNAHADSPSGLFFTSYWDDLLVAGSDQTLKYFVGAIRSVKKIGRRDFFRILLISPSTDFLNFAANVSKNLIKTYGLKASMLGEDVINPDSCEVLLGSPQKFILNRGILEPMGGAVIVDDIEKILSNDKQLKYLCKIFETIQTASLNIVFVNICSVFTRSFVSVSELSKTFNLRLKIAATSDNSSEKCKNADSKGEKRSRSHSLDLAPDKRTRWSVSKTASVGKSPTSSSSNTDSSNYKRKTRNESNSIKKSRWSDSKHDAYSSENVSRSSAPSQVRRYSELPQSSISEHFTYSGNKNTHSYTDQDDIRKHLGIKLYHEYVQELEKLRINFEKEFALFKNSPERCPYYDSCVDSFTEMYSRQHSGKGEDHKWKLWGKFWNTKFEEIKNEEWQLKQKSLLEEFEKVSKDSRSSSQSVIELSNPIKEFEKGASLPSSGQSSSRQSNRSKEFDRKSSLSSLSGRSSTKPFNCIEEFESRDSLSSSSKSLVRQSNHTEQIERKATSYTNYMGNVHESDGRQFNPVSSVVEVCHSVNKEEGSFGFTEALSMLEKLCDLIGFLGPSLQAMVSSCRELGLNTVEAYNIFTGAENVMVVNMILEKVKTLILSTTGDKLSLLQKAVRWIPKLLEEAERGPETKSESEKMPIDIDAIAKVSLGKPPNFTLKLIKTALAYEGMPNPPVELVNDLFLKICKIHFTLAMDE